MFAHITKRTIMAPIPLKMKMVNLVQLRGYIGDDNRSGFTPEQKLAM
jgi:hypothetical protein